MQPTDKELHINKAYGSQSGILVAVDSIIFGVQNNKLHLLLFKRTVEPLAGKWSLIGSFVDVKENVDNAAKRVLKEITGLEDLYMQQLHSFGNADRDPGGRVISIAYWSLIRINQNNSISSTKEYEAKWFPFNKIPELIIDHNQMVEKAINHLREGARFHPIGFELLPEKFTISQLLNVYESIFNTEIDDRNFRKKILKSGLLIDLRIKDMTTSRKGSFLYSFNQERYKLLLKNGYNFDFSF